MSTYEIARKRAIAKLGFYIHAATFVSVNLILIAVNLMTAPQNLWFYWPLLGWGIGLLFHGLLIFLAGNSDHKILENMIEKELKNLDRVEN